VRRVRSAIGVLAAGALAAATCAQTSGTLGDATLRKANAALQAGEADKALALLTPLMQQGAGLAEASNLACRVRLTLEQWNEAAKECEQAVKMEGNNSVYRLWLGRALGERADRASFLSAYPLAKRVREEFEEAVRLNPRNAEALSDLGEFYEEAPSLVGGGEDKAEGVAAQLDKLDPARAHELRARIAEKRKDYGAAEREFKQAIAARVRPAAQWIALASFYRRRQRWAEMEYAVRTGQSAAQRDRLAGAALFDGASLLIQSGRDPALAAKMLEDYLAGSQKIEEAPAFAARLRLARLKQQLGDSAAAQREQEAALALAREYRPAEDAKR